MNNSLVRCTEKRIRAGQETKCRREENYAKLGK